MTRDEILVIAERHSKLIAGWMFGAPQIASLWEEAFKAGAEAERQACAEICDDIEKRSAELHQQAGYPEDAGQAQGAKRCAAAIRGRAGK